MGKAERTLYTSARRIVQAFQSEQIPFTGAAGTELVCWSLDPVACLKSWFRRPSGAIGFEEGARLLERLETQLAVLQETEEPTREALSQWAGLASAWRGLAPSTPATCLSAVEACEEGMELITSQVQDLMDPLGLGSAPEGGMSRADGARKALDDLATVVRAKAPGLFAARDGGDTGRNREKLEALSQVLYEDTKLRADPFEWVYEGLAPMLLSDVLQRRSGAPAALAIAAAAVGRRVGLPLLPLPAAPIEAGAGSGDDGASAGLPPLDSLPPDLALRLSTRTQAVAPGPGPWVLRFDPGIDLTSKVADEAAIYVDAGSGEVMEGVAVRERYPALAGVSGEGWREQSVLRTWQGLARLAIQAHQRRGESDHVAHWVYLTLALDPQAPEWAHAMAAPELSA